MVTDRVKENQGYKAYVEENGLKLLTIRKFHFRNGHPKKVENIPVVAMEIDMVVDKIG